MDRAFARSLALAALLTLALATRSSANCGAESCPLNPQRLEGSAGRWTFDLGYQYVEQDRLWDGSHRTGEVEDVGHITERLTRTRTWTLNGRALVLPSLRLSATLPYLHRRHEHDLRDQPGSFVTSTWEYEGLGDAVLLAQWAALGAPERGAGAVTVQGGVKLPTGRRHVAEVDGEEPEPPARPGTGSTDALAGVQLMRHLRLGAPGGRHVTTPLVLSVLGRRNGRGTEDYRSGDEFHASLSTGYPLFERVTLLGQLNLLAHGRDEVGETDAEPEHTGGTSLFATPGLRVDLPSGPALYGYWQARVYERTNGPQLVAPSHWIVGLSVGLGR